MHKIPHIIVPPGSNFTIKQGQRLTIDSIIFVSTTGGESVNIFIDNKTAFSVSVGIDSPQLLGPFEVRADTANLTVVGNLLNTVTTVILMGVQQDTQ